MKRSTTTDMTTKVKKRNPSSAPGKVAVTQSSDGYGMFKVRCNDPGRMLLDFDVAQAMRKRG